MDIKLPNLGIKRRSASAPKARLGQTAKPAELRAFPALSLGQRRPSHCPGQPGPFLREQGPLSLPPGSDFGPFGSRLGMPLNIGEVARLIGCSPWTVRQTLIPRGLPHFRFKASGRLIFYRDQVIRWIQTQQQGGKTTK
jgi:hypothetical protein